MRWWFHEARFKPDLKVRSSPEDPFVSLVEFPRALEKFGGKPPLGVMQTKAKAKGKASDVKAQPQGPPQTKKNPQEKGNAG